MLNFLCMITKFPIIMFVITDLQLINVYFINSVYMCLWPFSISNYQSQIKIKRKILHNSHVTVLQST
jgi:hypothetical protein